MGRFVLLLSMALAIARPGRAHACSCAELPFETERSTAAAIFEAQVASVETIEGTTHVRLDVVQTWRAAEHEHVEVVTASTDAACGYAFEVGRSYLVYASSVEGDAYRVSLCSRTRRMEDADDDRSLLGSGVVPVDIVDAPEEAATTRAPPTHAGCASCSVGGTRTRLAPLFALAFAVFVVLRAGRTSPPSQNHVSKVGTV